MRNFLVLSLLVQLCVCAPQGPTETVDNNGGSADDQSEMLPYEVVETNDKYEVRELPASTWMCTQRKINVNDDPMKDWENRFESPYAAVASAAFEDSDDSEMFMKIFKYIIGVNSEGVEIEMTRPVTTKRTPFEEEEGMEMHETCFWSGTPWINKELPKPMDSEVVIKKKEQVQVYVKQFGGWAMSEEDWQTQHQQLRDDLKELNDVESNEYYTVGYNSPFSPKNRRNEIWIERIQNKVETDNNNNKGAQNANSYESKSETLPYEVVETAEGYELRKYPSAKFACTNLTDYDYSDDFLKNWQNVYETPMEAMAARKNQESYKPKKQMFRELYKYISGVNEDYAEIEMTSPVPKKHVLKEGTTLEFLEMCFWSGTPWTDKEMPKPVRPEVYLKQSKEIMVYVRQFGGWALSRQDWDNEKENLVEALGDKEYEKNVYYTVGYNSPWTMTDRKNEVWFLATQEDI